MGLERDLDVLVGTMVLMAKAKSVVVGGVEECMNVSVVE